MKNIEPGSSGRKSAEKIDEEAARLKKRKIRAATRQEVKNLGLKRIPTGFKDGIFEKIEMIESVAESRETPGVEENIDYSVIIRRQLEIYKKYKELTETFQKAKALFAKLSPRSKFIELSLESGQPHSPQFCASNETDLIVAINHLLNKLKKVQEAFGSGSLKGKKAWRITGDRNILEDVVKSIDQKGNIQLENYKGALFLGSGMFSNEKDAKKHLNVQDFKRKSKSVKRKGSRKKVIKDKPQESERVIQSRAQNTSKRQVDFIASLKGSISH